MSDTSSPLPKDHPLVVAWEEYRATDEYANTRKWALHEQHVDGSLWAAFMAGWNCVPDTAEVAKLKEQLAAHVRISTRCPACGASTLFISDSGQLCCSLLGCPDPTRINNPREHEARLLEEMAGKFSDEAQPGYFYPNAADKLRREAAARRTK